MARATKMAASEAPAVRRRNLLQRLQGRLLGRTREIMQMQDNGQSIYELVKHLEAAWNNSDSRRFAEAFLEDADFITIFGTHYNGRDQVDANHRRIFDTIYKDSRNHFAIESVRFVRPDVVVVFVQATLELKDGKTLSARPSLLLTKEGGKWRIAVLHNTAVFAGQP